MTPPAPFNLLFFEDPHCKKFHPLTLTRPMTDLRIGTFTIGEKWNIAVNPDRIARMPLIEGGTDAWVSGIGELGDKFQNDLDCLLVNSRLLPGEKIVSALNDLENGEVFETDSTLLAGRVAGSRLDKLFEVNRAEKGNSVTDSRSDSLNLAELFEKKLPIPGNGFRIVETLPDLLAFNGSEIEQDLSLTLAKPRGSNIQLSPHALLYFENNIFIGDRTEIEAGAILIADDGPIVIGSDVKIMAGALIRGPVSIGNASTIKMGAKIYGDTTIGPVCKIAGEVQNTIVHSYSNKAHEGFVGNSILGQWCNLGADTNTSNLKNNYSTVSMTDWETGVTWDTGTQFLGTIMGDHSRTGINTMLNTGTICGVSCNIFGSGFPPKQIPSFSWVDGTTISPYQVDKAIETMGKVMARRNIDLSPDYIDMMRRIAELR